MDVLYELASAEFLDSDESGGCDSLPCFGCDAGPLPPGCDCICHTPCDFGRVGDLNGKSDIGDEVYEIE